MPRASASDVKTRRTKNAPKSKSRTQIKSYFNFMVDQDKNIKLDCFLANDEIPRLNEGFLSFTNESTSTETVEKKALVRDNKAGSNKKQKQSTKHHSFLNEFLKKDDLSLLLTDKDLSSREKDDCDKTISSSYDKDCFVVEEVLHSSAAPNNIRKFINQFTSHKITPERAVRIAIISSQILANMIEKYN